MMHIWGVLGDPKNASRIPPCRGDSLLERERVLERSRDGVREGPGEKRRSDDARAPGVGGIGATPCRGKPLEWTGSALDHGGVAGFKGLRRCRRPRHEGAGAAADLEETASSNPSLQSAGVALRCKQHGEEKVRSKGTAKV